MARRRDPNLEAHQEWIGFVRPTGLVVSAPALVRAGAILNQHDREGQEFLRECTEERQTGDQTTHMLPDFRAFAKTVLNWSFSPGGYVGTEEAPIPDELTVHLPDFGDTLRPDFAVRERSPDEDGSPWQLLVRTFDEDQGFDDREQVTGSTLDASPHGRMERLLRQTEVRAGLLFNGRALRLISAPRGESSGWLDYRVEEMVQTAGRPICAAMRLLLSQRRLLALPQEERLSALLEDSRKFQNEVSEKLAGQVLHALYELLRGMQAAHDQSKGKLLNEVLTEDPDEVYRALLTVLLRIVFLLYAEERDMLPSSDVYQQYYGIAGLHERLREDSALYPDTMDQRYGAWAQLIGLHRMIYDGADLGDATLPQRHGVLFDPDRFPFLEGRRSAGVRQVGARIEPPLVPDGTVYRALEKLLILDGERISYRALDVEQIGSVYETMMGFRLETASGRSLAIRSKNRYGASTTVDLEALLETKASKRRKWLQDEADRKVSVSVNRELKAAESVNDLHGALRPVVDRAATPDVVPPGAMVLQPSEERRKSGSHYTPRSLTEPIVRKTLEPLLRDLADESGGPLDPEEILGLTVCDPAMGSGAFLVETCRQLGDALLDAWKAGDGVPSLPPDEDEVIFARRSVAQRCIYGVDRNPVAVDLAKVSLWLVTLARDHAFTFLDHALRHGDSLVGLSGKQIEEFHWESTDADHQPGFETMRVKEHVNRIRELRTEIRHAGEAVADWELRALWEEADEHLGRVRLFGDLLTAAYFEGRNKTAREERRNDYAQQVIEGTAERHATSLAEKRSSDPPLAPFHWEIEYPEVFGHGKGGFDGFVGNPPFAGKNTAGSANIDHYLDWLKEIHPGSHGNSDLVAHFFRRCFNKLRIDGCLGLIATNTIAQGDTRNTGLCWICQNDGTIYHASSRVKWPGRAAVVVSVVHVRKGRRVPVPMLDGREVERITAFLFHRGGHDDPAQLEANAGQSFQGSIVLGMGLTFDDTDTKSVATPISEMKRLIQKKPENAEVIFPYIGGAEVNSRPDHAHHRYVINFGDRSEEVVRTSWPDLMEIVEEKVRPEREKNTRNAIARRRARFWWQFASPASDLYGTIGSLGHVLVVSRVGQHAAFARISSRSVFADSLVVFPFETYSAFCALQCRIHEVWARFLGSSMKDDLRYTPTDVFETFPFPPNWSSRDDLAKAGRQYYEFRADLMIKNDEGLTDTFNRFHHPNERDPEIKKLRELHAEMDRAVLDAYGWDDIHTDCEFLLDYEIDEENWNPRKKKPWRCRWPDKVHDEVLARLLELNDRRAEAERMGAGKVKPEPELPHGSASPTSGSSENRELFDE